MPCTPSQQMVLVRIRERIDLARTSVASIRIDAEGDIGDPGRHLARVLAVATEALDACWATAAVLAEPIEEPAV